MFKYLFCILFLCVPVFINAQSNNIIIVDKNGNAIDLVYILNRTTGLLIAETDELGNARIDFNYDSLKVSLIRMGYEQKDTILYKKNDRVVIDLNEDTINLDEFTIISSKSQKPIKEKYRLDRRNSRVSNHVHQALLGTLFVPKINKDYDEIYLSKLVVKTKYHTLEKVTNTRPFRVRFFENKNGIPGDEITPTEIVYHPKRKARKIKIDLINQRVKVPQKGFFVFFQMLSTETSTLLIDGVKGKKGVWHRNAKEGSKFYYSKDLLDLNIGYEVLRYKSE